MSLEDNVAFDCPLPGTGVYWNQFQTSLVMTQLPGPMTLKHTLNHCDSSGIFIFHPTQLPNIKTMSNLGSVRPGKIYQSYLQNEVHDPSRVWTKRPEKFLHTYA